MNDGADRLKLKVVYLGKNSLAGVHRVERDNGKVVIESIHLVQRHLRSGHFLGEQGVRQYLFTRIFLADALLFGHFYILFK